MVRRKTTTSLPTCGGSCVLRPRLLVISGVRAINGLLASLAAFGWCRWLARGAREPSVLAPVADVPLPEPIARFLGAACTAGE